jgi:putative glutathione S-transferase
MVRGLKGLQAAIDVSIVDPVWVTTKPDVDEHRGWGFGSEFPGATGDKIYGTKSVRELYEKLCGDVAVAKFTVPMLVDTKTGTVVNNESSEIIRMFNSDCNAIAEHPDAHFYPEALRAQIDEVNDWVYPQLNNGVYRSGFATTQEACESFFWSPTAEP